MPRKEVLNTGPPNVLVRNSCHAVTNSKPKQNKNTLEATFNGHLQEDR